MKKIIISGMIGLLLAACGERSAPQDKKAPRPEYRTTAPSLLYFKNMRSSYYQMAEQPESRIELYRLRKFSPPLREPLLVPVIANNWLEDEAYLFLETAGNGSAFATPLTVRWEGQDKAAPYQLQPASAARQQELALQVYEGLQEGRRLEAMAADSSWVSLFENREFRGHYITTVRDYLRLTERY